MREMLGEADMKLDVFAATRPEAAGAIGAAIWGGYRHCKLLEAA
jgi:hypothetical protein